MRGARRGCVRLRGAIIGIDDEDDSTFTITTNSCKDDPKTFHFQTRNGEERERWVRALEDTILRHSHTVCTGMQTTHSCIIHLKEGNSYIPCNTMTK